MCKRLARYSNLAAVRARFRVRARTGTELAPTWNMSAGARAPVVRRGESGRREIAALSWGLPLDHPLLDETENLVLGIEAGILRRAALLESIFETQRCIVPADAFYLGPAPWARQGRIWAFALQDEALMGIAALWLPDANSEAGGAFAIVTTGPNESAALLDDSMPAILFSGDERAWLNPAACLDDAYRLIKPYPAELMRAWPVAADGREGDGPELLHRVA